MANRIKMSINSILFPQNIVSFLLYCLLISKAYSHAPLLWRALSKKLGLTDWFCSTEEVKSFGRFRLPLAKCMFFRNTHTSYLKHRDSACYDEGCLKTNLRDLFDLISAAQKEILICCYTFTYPDLAQVIMEAHDRNVDIRVVTDFESTALRSKVPNFREKGITVKMTETSYHFHHKFIILDRTVLINGSTNFTKKGMIHNFDSLLVTSDPIFIEKYVEEFNFLWNNSKLTY